MQQYVKGLAHHHEEDAERLARLLRQIKGFLWNGNLHEGQAVIEDLVMDLDEIETAYPRIRALRKTASYNRIWCLKGVEVCGVPC